MSIENEIRESAREKPVVDAKRVDAMRNIRLETDFFQAFRNQTRILLNQPKLYEERKNIEIILKDETILYQNKIRILTRLLKSLLLEDSGQVDGKIQFVKFDEQTLNTIRDKTQYEILSCVRNPDEKDYCDNKESGTILLMPKNNLITGSSNKRIYLLRVADELVRNMLMRNFYLNTNAYVSVSEQPYRLKDDELILMEDLLQKEYFEDLKPI